MEGPILLADGQHEVDSRCLSGSITLRYFFLTDSYLPGRELFANVDGSMYPRLFDR